MNEAILFVLESKRRKDGKDYYYGGLVIDEENEQVLIPFLIDGDKTEPIYELFTLALPYIPDYVTTLRLPVPIRANCARPVNSKENPSSSWSGIRGRKSAKVAIEQTNFGHLNLGPYTSQELGIITTPAPLRDPISGNRMPHGGRVGGGRVGGVRVSGGFRSHHHHTTSGNVSGQVSITVLICGIVAIGVVICIGVGATWVSTDKEFIDASYGTDATCIIYDIQKENDVDINYYYYQQCCSMSKYIFYQTVQFSDFPPVKYPIGSNITCYTQQPNICDAYVVIQKVYTIAPDSLAMLLTPLCAVGFCVISFIIYYFYKRYRWYQSLKTKVVADLPPPSYDSVIASER